MNYPRLVNGFVLMISRHSVYAKRPLFSSVSSVLLIVDCSTLTVISLGMITFVPSVIQFIRILESFPVYGIIFPERPWLFVYNTSINPCLFCCALLCGGSYCFEISPLLIFQRRDSHLILNYQPLHSSCDSFAKLNTLPVFDISSLPSWYFHVLQYTLPDIFWFTFQLLISHSPGTSFLLPFLGSPLPNKQLPSLVLPYGTLFLNGRNIRL